MSRPRACGALIQNNTILMVRHAEQFRSYWTLPGGGVEAGETPAEAAEREMAEETGLRVRTVRELWEGVFSPEYCFLVELTDQQQDAPALGLDPEEAHLTLRFRRTVASTGGATSGAARDAGLKVARVLRALAEPA